MQLSTQKELSLSKSLKDDITWFESDDQRSSLYFDQYQWCVNFTLAEAHCLRDLDEDRFERSIKNSKYWSRHYQNDKQWEARGTETALRKTRAFLLALSEPIKTMISSSHVYVYTNDSTLGSRLYQANLRGVQLRRIRRAVVSMPSDRIQLRHSDYQYRTYFKERLCDDHQKMMLRNFFQSRQGTFRVSPALAAWLTSSVPIWQNRRIQRYHFVDHDHPNEGTMISLVMPGIVRKTLPIETTK
jgi:hypothetical protein